MNNTNQGKKMLGASSHVGNKPRSDLPKLTVAQIVEKFVTPSSHRMVVQAEVSKIKTNKK